jgi:hypothetical protein
VEAIAAPNGSVSTTLVSASGLTPGAVAVKVTTKRLPPPLTPDGGTGPVVLHEIATAPGDGCCVMQDADRPFAPRKRLPAEVSIDARVRSVGS